jgi:hypothetical protein
MRRWRARDLKLLLAGALAIMLSLVRLEIAPVAAGPSCNGPSRALARLELMFGSSRPGGVQITEEEWTAFLDTEVTPRFPDGLTALEGTGQWRGRAGVVTKERSNILVIWHEPTRSAEVQIEAIRAAYKQRFEQESVMRVDSISCVSF